MTPIDNPDNAKVTRPSVFAGKISVGLVKKIHTQDPLSGENFNFLPISKHSSLVKLGVVWLNAKTYQTDCPVKKYKLSRRLIIRSVSQRSRSNVMPVYYTLCN